MACMRRSLTVSLLALACAGGAVRAEQVRQPAGHGTQKGGVTPDKGSKPPALPTKQGTGKPGQPQQYNPKELGVDK